MHALGHARCICPSMHTHMHAWAGRQYRTLILAWLRAKRSAAFSRSVSAILQRAGMHACMQMSIVPLHIYMHMRVQAGPWL